jgi:hypothetical protein
VSGYDRGSNQNRGFFEKLPKEPGFLGGGQGRLGRKEHNKYQEIFQTTKGKQSYGSKEPKNAA